MVGAPTTATSLKRYHQRIGVRSALGRCRAASTGFTSPLPHRQSTVSLDAHAHAVRGWSAPALRRVPSHAKNFR
jgi:hypothetical protein